jgi:hypothetical protein
MQRTTLRPSLPRLAWVAAISLLALGGCRDDSSASGDDDDDDAGTDSAGTVDDTGTEATGADMTGGTDDTTGGDEEDLIPAPGGIRRLVGREYTATVEMLLGSAAADVAAPPVDTAQEGFDAVGAALLALDAVAVEQYETSAGRIADAVVADPSRLAETVPCVTQSPAPACYEDVARDFGRLAFRRPLDQEEIDALTDVGQHGYDWGEGDFNAGLRYQLTAILQMPSFIYLVEVGEPDDPSGFRRLDPYELVTRMSIFLLGRGPDASALALAEANGLETEDDIREAAMEMVGTIQAREALAGFFDEYLRLRELESTAKNPDNFPMFSTDLARSMRQETQLLVHDIVWERNGDYRELFTADYTFVNDRLAELYGVAAPDQAGIYERIEWPANQNRSGYISQASFLTHQSSSLRNSPTKRGRFIQQSVWCTDIPPPPPGVEPTLPPLPENITLREQLLMHMEDPTCAPCHSATDPLGFAFEHYDAIGAYRTTEPNGLPVSSNGEIEGVGSWDNAQDLAAVIAADPRTSKCVVNNLVRGILGHRETPGEEPAIAALDVSFIDSGYSMQSLLVTFPTSSLFRLVDEPK